MSEVFEMSNGDLVYVLPRGGKAFRQVFTLVTVDILAKLSDCARRWPYENDAIVNRLKADLAHSPAPTRWLACETAFFSTLPATAASYALPASLNELGFDRYGADGFFHQWVGSQYPHERIVSVFLGEHPNAAAIDKGSAVETTAGYSMLEGLPGLSTCGDLDPSIVLLLAENGLTPKQIEEKLSVESGWQAIVGEPCGFEQLLSSEGERFVLARAMFTRSLIKAIGAILTSLGGADRIVVGCASIGLCQPFYVALQKSLSFTGVKMELLQVNPKQILEFLFKDKGNRI
jgi:acetate kinase